MTTPTPDKALEVAERILARPWHAGGNAVLAKEYLAQRSRLERMEGALRGLMARFVWEEHENLPTVMAARKALEDA